VQSDAPEPTVVWPINGHMVGELRDKDVVEVPDFKGLMALVGHLLLRWGTLEHRLAGAPVPSELDYIRQIRNALCHQMIAARADPHGEGVAYVSCRARDGSITHVSATELEEATRELEARPICTDGIERPFCANC